MYSLEQHQLIAATPQDAWAFLQHPANLDEITPPDLKFRIVSDVPEVMYNGLIVEYRITIPLLGTHTWITEIKHIREGYSFVDEQRIGPYRFWYHYHQVEPHEKGVMLYDLVSYQPPFGIAGKMMHSLYIRRTLERIFAFRRVRLEQILTAKERQA
jgi:ligand-binding SRPBCC domain-containing protein